jgi:geranylgeranyl pyrophosphate synthase
MATTTQQQQQRVPHHSPAGVRHFYGSDAVLLEPYSYLREIPGKEIRSKLIDAFNRWLQIPENVLVEVKLIVQMLHTSSLMYSFSLFTFHLHLRSFPHPSSSCI